jgi:hypothetical protein
MLRCNEFSVTSRRLSGTDDFRLPRPLGGEGRGEGALRVHGEEAFISSGEALIIFPIC